MEEIYAEIRTRKRKYLNERTKTAASRLIMDFIKNIPELKKMKDIFVFSPNKDEPDILPIFRWKRQFHFLGDESITKERAIGGVINFYKSHKEIDPQKLEAVIVPGEAFDNRGNRLGKKRDKYKKILEKLPESCLKIGVCFSFQLLDNIPEKEEKMHYIITDRGILRSPEKR